MQPDPISALRKVINAVEESDLLTPLSHINQATRPEDASDFVPLLLSSFGEFRGSAREFSAQEKRVCEIMKLGTLFHDPLWQGLVRAREIAPDQLVQLHDLHTRIHFAINYAPGLLALSEDRDASFKRVPDDKSVLALGIRPLDAAQGVDTSQLSHALHGIEMVYVACCAMNALDPGQIVVQNWRGQPLPMFSVLVDKAVRGSIDNVLTAMIEVVSEHQGHRSRNSLTDSIIASTVFRQLDAVSEAGVLDARAHDETAELLLDGCLELLSASVIPPGMPLATQAKLDTLAVIAEHEMREHLQGAGPAAETPTEGAEEPRGNVVPLIGSDSNSAYDSADEYADSDDEYEEYEDDHYGDEPDLGHESGRYASVDDERHHDDFDDDPENALQIVVEMDGEPVEYETEAEAHEPEPAPDVEYVEPEVVTNKAFKRALKDLRKGRRR